MLLDPFARTVQGFQMIVCKEWLKAGHRIHIRTWSLSDTCWWYSLCNFLYRQHYEQTCSYNFDCWIYTRIYFYNFILCLNTRTSMINTNPFFDLIDLIDVQVPGTGNPPRKTPTVPPSSCSLPIACTNCWWELYGLILWISKISTISFLLGLFSFDFPFTSKYAFNF